MQAIFFPFTFITPETASIAFELCGQLKIYTISKKNMSLEMAHKIEQGHVEVDYLADEDVQKIEQKLIEYRDWIMLHANEAQTILQAQKANQLAEQEKTPNQLRSEIRGLQLPEAKTQEAQLFSDYLFLTIAQDHDQNQLASHEKFSQTFDIESKMCRDLQVETLAPGEKPKLDVSPRLPDLGENKTMERLRAWSRYYLSKPTPSRIFFTDSSAVFSQTLNTHQNPFPVIDLQIDKTSLPKLSQHLNNIVVTPDISSDERRNQFLGLPSLMEKTIQGVNIKLSLYENLSPRDLFTACAQPFDIPLEDGILSSGPTLIACVG